MEEKLYLKPHWVTPPSLKTTRRWRVKGRRKARDESELEDEEMNTCYVCGQGRPQSEKRPTPSNKPRLALHGDPTFGFYCTFPPPALRVLMRDMLRKLHTFIQWKIKHKLMKKIRLAARCS